MDKNRLRKTRLHKEEISLDKDPLENAFVKREGDLNFYFCFYDLEDDFTNGFYFGLLQLHLEYPFYAPKLFMYTPNGRYEQNLPICTSFTNYHQESWTSAWNVRSLIQATISFMYANEPSYGCRADPPQIRKKYARDSLTWNFNNELFLKIFGQTIKSKLQEIVKLGIHIYDKLLIVELRKLGLYEANAKNLKPTIQNPQNKVYNHPINEREKPFEQLNRPLIRDHQIRQIQQELDRMNLENNQQNQRENRRLIDEENRRKRQKTKKIIKIIGLIAVAAGFGFLIYYSTYRPQAQVSPSQNTLNARQKSGRFFNLIDLFSENFMGIFQILRPKSVLKILVNNN